MLFVCVVISFGMLSSLMLAEGNESIYKVPLNSRVRQVNNPTTVAFSAHRLHDTSLSTGETIVFDGVETNIGHGYNNNNGRFTCPVDGTYFFTVNILSYIEQLLEAYIVLDGTPVAGLYTVGSHSDDDQSTASVVIHCSAGQHVWVKSLGNYPLNGEVIGYTQFTGFLVGNSAHADLAKHAIAFSAFKTHDEVFTSSKVIVFDGVTTNIGNSYNNATGQFICRLNGLYFFTANVMSHGNAAFEAFIMLSNKPVAGLRAIGASSTLNDHSTSSVVVHCTEGQRVSVMSQNPPTSVNGEQVGYTQLTGFLLAADETTPISEATPFPTVGFSAFRHSDYKVLVGEAVIFDGIVSNQGAAYNTVTGKFTCPEDGAYYFTLNILSYVNLSFDAYIMLENRPIAAVYATGANPSVDDQSSTAVAVHCNVGQHVWVKSVRSQWLNGEAVGYSQFSGFLIAPGTPASIVG